MNYSLVANVELLFMNACLVALLFSFNLRYWKPRVINHLSVIYVMVFLGCFFEMGAFIVDGRPELIAVNYFSNILYLGSIGILGQQMLDYCNEIYPIKFWRSGRSHFLTLLPLFAELAILIASPWLHLIFYVDELGFYHRGAGFVFQMIPYVYVLATTAVGIHCFRHAETKREKNMYLALAGFSVPPFVLGGLQLLIKANSLDILEFSIVLSLLANYAVAQNNRITRDTLTQLPNREDMDAILKEKMQGTRRDCKDQLFVMMGDLDDFKGINDSCGHVEGDRALIQTADVLYRVSAAYNASAARFGGDEFVIILEAADETLPAIIMHEIDRRLQEMSEDEAYHLKMSIGFTCYKPGDSIQDILKRADQELYKVKRERKAGRRTA